MNSVWPYQGFKLGHMTVPVDHRRQRLVPEHQVLGHRHARHQREVLVDHAETQMAGLSGIGDRNLLAVNGEGPGIGAVISHDAFHQGALAGTVFAEQSVKGAGLEADRDIVQSRQRTEPFGHGIDGDVGRRWRWR